jgi:cytochrome c-type biogenesis protein CcmF
MVVAHLGVAVFVVGVTLVKTYERDQDAKLRPGEAIELAGYRFLLDDVSDVKGPNYIASRATISVTRGGKPVTVLHPEKRLYTVQRTPMTEAAIEPGLTRDLYVSLGDPLEGGAWFVKAYYKPFVDWIWGGCVIMALGGFLAASDRRYRVSMPSRKAEAVAGARA